ncbi:MAG: MmcQ/YjbR family DNA-binding protein [Caulobacteraceae bacterium]
MAPEDFRRMALSFPDAEQGSHFGNPDFRIKGKIFATLGGSTGRPVVQLTPEEQALLMEAEPGMFVPASGAWGRNGSTHIVLDHADEATVRDALERAYRKVSTSKPRRRPAARS